MKHQNVVFRNQLTTALKGVCLLLRRGSSVKSEK